MAINLPLPPDVSNHPLVGDDKTMTRVYSNWFNSIYQILIQAQTGAPGTANYVLNTSSGLLPNAQVLSGLNTGFAKINNGSGLFTTQTTINSTDLTSTSVTAGTYTINGTNAYTVNAQGQLTAATNISVGTVTSVTFTGDGTVLSSTPSSAVTTSGTLTASLKTQTKNTVLAGPTTGANANPTFRSLVGSDLPSPSATTLGGIESYTAVSNQWINSISTSGVPTSTQPAFSNISGTATVSQGGTGDTSLTAYAVLCGGTTSTGAIQSIAGLGSSGNVLTSNGPSALPTFQASSSTTGLFIQVIRTVYTSSSTWTRNTKTAYALIEVLGGGAQGGGVASIAGLASAAGAGGGAGARGVYLFTAAQIGTGANTVTVGAGGSTSAAGANTGQSGGSSSVALGGTGTITITASGGIGGAGATAATAVVFAAGGIGGTVTNGELAATGESGANGIALGTTLGSISGEGANTDFGGGGLATFTVNGSNNGNAASGYGAGGSGAVAAQAGAAVNKQGGAGTAGFVVIQEYITN